MDPAAIVLAVAEVIMPVAGIGAQASKAPHTVVGASMLDTNLAEGGAARRLSVASTVISITSVIAAMRQDMPLAPEL
jgi:hypothetical protein